MNQKEILTNLTNDASDENVAIALDWLEKRKKSSSGTNKLIVTLLSVRQDQETLRRIGEWISDKDWEPLVQAGADTKSREFLDWMITMARRGSDPVQVSKLWSCLCAHYNEKEIIDGASQWLIEHPRGEHSARVAEYLIRRGLDSRVIEACEALAIEFPEPFFLIRLVQYSDSEPVKQITRQLLLENKDNENQVILSLVANG
ncbi:MAG TPA: hypothetical protein V6C72_02410, partial [Chroococcales cyanobacterium]